MYWDYLLLFIPGYSGLGILFKNLLSVTRSVTINFLIIARNEHYRPQAEGEISKAIQNKREASPKGVWYCFFILI